MGIWRRRRGSHGGSVLRTLHQHRRVFALSYRKLVSLVLLATLSGLAQAAMLLILVRVATALTADTSLISGTVGPFAASDLTTAELILIGVVVLGVLFLAELATSWTQASLSADAQRYSQKRMLSSYSKASFDAQVALTRGDNSQMIFGHTGQAARLVTSLASGVVAIVNFGTLVGSALILSPTAGLVVMGGLFVMLACLRPLAMLGRRLGGMRATAQRRLSGRSVERLELTREIKAFGVEGDFDGPVRADIDAVAKLLLRLRVVSRMTSATYRTGSYGIVLGMLAVINASDATNLAALTGSLLMLLRSLSYGQAAQATYQELAEVSPVVEQLAAEALRLDRAEEEMSGFVPERGIGSMRIEKVGFAYPGSGRVLDGVDFCVNSGDLVALVGPSGAGKSTLMYLLLRLRQPSAGRLLVDGVDASEIDLAWWRRRVAYVPQEPKLPSGSVTDAIRFTRSDITNEHVQLAARRAHIADEIESWPDGYDTDVGQLGENVSGGQRQRIALARALAGTPDVLLLDEPTSSVDPTSERLIAQTLEELRGEMTVVVIAHRFNTVQRANRVVLLQDGRLIPHATDDLATLASFMEE